MISGDCGATYLCITSPNYPENYAPDGSCVIKLASLFTLDVKDFRTEVLWETMVVNSQNYSGSTDPVGVEADGEISCFLAGAGPEKNWTMYADMTTPAPTLPLALSPTSLIVVSDGKCNVVGDWVHSPNIPQITRRIWRVTFVSEAIACFLWTISPTENSLVYFPLDWDTSRDTAVTSDSLLLLVIRLQHKPQRMDVVC